MGKKTTALAAAACSAVIAMAGMPSAAFAYEVPRTLEEADVWTSDDEYAEYLASQEEKGKTDLSDAWLEFRNGSHIAPYTGSPTRPSFSVEVGDVTLVEGTDYTVSYEKLAKSDDERGEAIDAPVEIGYYALVVHGTGKYTGTAVGAFQVEDVRDFSSVSGKTVVSGIDDHLGTVTWSGEAVKANVTVFDGAGRELSEGTDYDGTWQVRKSKSEWAPIKGSPKAVGGYRYAYTGKGTYSGMRFGGWLNIAPPAPKGVKVKAGKKSVRISWKRSKQADGYIVSTEPVGRSTLSKTVRVKGASKTSATIKSLRKGKKYTVMLQAYKKVPPAFDGGDDIIKSFASHSVFFKTRK